MKLVDVVVATPSMLLPHDPADYPNIKAVAVAGEPCPKSTNFATVMVSTLSDLLTCPDLADAWAARVKFYNCCGPTEVMDFCHILVCLI